MALDWQVDNAAGLPVCVSLSNTDYYSREQRQQLRDDTLLSPAVSFRSLQEIGTE